MNTNRDYTSRNKVLSARTQYANLVVERYLMETGQKILYPISLPDNPHSAITQIDQGIASTTPAEVSAYLSTVVTPNTTQATTVIVLPAPIDLDAIPASGEIIINFKQTNPTGSPITNYEYTLNGGSFITLDPSRNISPITISGLTNGIEYTITIRAVNANGPGATSASVTATPSE